MSFDSSQFNLTFVKLANGEHHFSYEINDTFFEHFGNQEISGANVRFNATITKSDSMLVIDLSGTGTLKSTCDRCLDSLEFAVNPVFRVIAHLNSNEDETVLSDDLNLQLIYLRSSDFQLNLASSIYESFLPCIPMVKTCEIMEHKQCDDSVTRIIDNNSTNVTTVDPRWDKLKQLLNKKEK